MEKNIKKSDLKQLQKPEMAQHFLRVLSQGDPEIFTFQTFNDKNKSEEAIYPKVLNGTFEEQVEALLQLQEKGAGVFVTVNQTDGKGRKTENIIKVRAFFVDLDGAPLAPILSAPLAPHIVIESSPGRYHAYWIIKGAALKNFSCIQKQLIERFNSDPKVFDLPRVMRLPGFLHQKKEPFLTHIFQESREPPFSLQTFLDAFSIDFAFNTSSFHTNSLIGALKKHNMVIKQENHPQGCWTIRCPWEHLHTQTDHGTKYYEPNTNGYPEHGFQCFHTHCSHKGIQDLMEFLGLTRGIGPIDPLPLRRDIGNPKPYPFGALGEILGPAAMAIHDIVKAPDAICAQSVLAASALVTQPFFNVVLDGRETPLSSFFLTIAESGDRKTATDKIALKPVYKKQEELVNKHRIDFHTYEMTKEAQGVRKKDWLQKHGKNPIGEAFNELPICQPIHPLLLVDEPTYEGVVKYLVDGQPSIGLFSDEGGRFFGGYAMNSDNVLKTTAGLSSLWDGKPINRMRSGDGNMILFGRRFSLHLMIQEMILKQLMDHSLVEVQGFLPRCLMAFPVTTAGNRSYVEEDISLHPDILSYWKIIGNLLNRKYPTEEPPAPQNELHPRPLPLTKEAKLLWIQYHDCIDKKIAPKQVFHPIRRLASKAAEHVLRLSGVLTVIENLEAMEITQQNVENAIELMEYYLEERLRIQGFLSMDTDLMLASDLLEWCWERNKELISLQECYQYGPHPIRTADRAREIFSILEKHEWVIPKPNSLIGKKRHKEAWAIKPPLKEC